MGCVSGSTNIGPLERTVELNQAESTVNLRFPLWCPAPALGCKGLWITEIASLVVVVVFNVCRFIQHRIHICRGRTLASKWQLQHNLTFPQVYLGLGSDQEIHNTLQHFSLSADFPSLQTLGTPSPPSTLYPQHHYHTISTLSTLDAISPPPLDPSFMCAEQSAFSIFVIFVPLLLLLLFPFPFPFPPSLFQLAASPSLSPRQEASNGFEAV